MPLFQQSSLFSNTWEDYFMIGITLILLILIIQLRQQSAGKDLKIYNARLAWMRAGIYFCVCFLASWATGVFKTVVHTPLASADNLANTKFGLAIALKRPLKDF